MGFFCDVICAMSHVNVVTMFDSNSPTITAAAGGEAADDYGDEDDDKVDYKCGGGGGSNTFFRLYPHMIYNNRRSSSSGSIKSGFVPYQSQQQGKRRSAVELLAESKSHYVKSEKVLDTKQELKNQDHLHVRSPTLDTTSITATTTMLRSPAPPIINGGGPFPFAMCLTCPPYPHQHFEHFDHYQLHNHQNNHHLSQGSLHLNQQQHHLNAPIGERGGGGGNSSGPPSVESGGTASTGSTGGGGGVTAITTLGRSGSGKHHSHHHHHHHHLHHSNTISGSHHTKSHRSSSTGSSGGSRHLQENFPGLPSSSTTLLIEPINISSSSLKTNTIGRSSKIRQIQPPGTLAIISKREFQNQLKKDSGNVLASLLPGMSFTLPAQSSLQKQSNHHHLHHHHHHHQHHHHSTNASHHTHQQLLLQKQALASSNKPSAIAVAATTASSSSTTSSSAAVSTVANGLIVVRTSTTSASTALSSSAQHHPNHQTVSSTTKSSNHGIGHHQRERSVEDDSPPPLPPKSPRITNTSSTTTITTKPTRPHDFPQQLQLQVVDPSIESAASNKHGGGGVNHQQVPPPPPRRHSNSSSQLPQKELSQQSQSKYLRLLQDQSTNKLPHSILADPTTQSMTLPSPILPPTPPPDVVMESPMSDSGPIISPPPAFSTPVTPMIDRQNSTTSDKSGGAGGASQVSSIPSTNPLPSTATGTRLRSLSQSTSHYHNITGFSLAPSISTSGIGGGGTGVIPPASKPHQHHSTSQSSSHHHHHYHTPLSGTVSMSAISAVSNGGGRNGNSNNTSTSATRNNKSIPDLSSARYSPLSRSRSNSSPMSPAEESIPASSPEDDDDDEDEDNDEDPTSSSLADNGHDGDDDCSEKGQSSSLSPKLLATVTPTGGMARRNSAKMHSHSSQQTITSKVTLIPKSVTENFLYKVGGTIQLDKTSAQTTAAAGIDVSVSQQTKPKAVVEAPSPARRPILRSKSDLSHRYAKAEKSGNLVGGHGFTLVQVDIGLPPPPPLPMHSSLSTAEFASKNTSGTGAAAAALSSSTLLPGSSGTLPASLSKSHQNHHAQQQKHYNNHSYHHPLHHHVYQTPHNSSMIGATSSVSTTQLASTSHYHEPFHANAVGSAIPSAGGGDGKRATKSASDLERFFDMLGLENTANATGAAASAPNALNEIPTKDVIDAPGQGRRKSGSESPVFFSSVSSVDSAPRRSGSADSEDSPLDDKLGSRTVGAGYAGKFGGVGGGPSIMVQHGEPSIVERNARVIKWLFNCRKAMERR